MGPCIPIFCGLDGGVGLGRWGLYCKVGGLFAALDVHVGGTGCGELVAGRERDRLGPGLSVTLVVGCVDRVQNGVFDDGGVQTVEGASAFIFFQLFKKVVKSHHYRSYIIS